MERKPKIHNFLAYGMGDFLGGGSFALIGLLFMYYMTEIVGLAPFYAGLLIFLGRGWTAFIDPLIGYISDNTRSRFGRRRIFFLIAFVPTGIFFALLWNSVNMESMFFTFLWYLFLFSGFSAFFSVLMVPYLALNAEISYDPKTRSVFTAFKQFCSGFSIAICTIGAKPFVDSFPEEQRHTGYMLMGIIFAIFFALPWLAVYWGTWELPGKVEPVKKQSVLEIFRGFMTVFRNKSFRILLAMFVFGLAGVDMLMALILYYLTSYMGMEHILMFLMIVIIASQALSMPGFIKIGNNYGQGKAYLVGAVLWLAGMLVAFTFNPDSSYAYLAFGCVLMGSGMCGVTVMPWVILPNVTDVDELITAKKRAGTYSGMISLIRKASNALVMLAVGGALTLIGYVPEAAYQRPETITGLRYLFFAGPFVVVLLGLILSLRFKITPYTHKVLMNEIQRLENGSPREEVDEETKRICETLSGLKYQNLYGSTTSNQITQSDFDKINHE